MGRGRGFSCGHDIGELLHKRAEGRLSDEEAAQLGRRMAACAACRGRADLLAWAGDRRHRDRPRVALDTPGEPLLGELLEDLVRAHGGVLEVRSGVALEGERLVEVEGEDAVAPLARHLVAQRADGDGAGAGRQLAAQHSQALEAWFCHVPGLKVVAPSTPADAKGLLKTSIRDDNPVIFIESEVLYGTKGEVPEGEHLIPLGSADIKRPGRDVTLIAHSKMVFVALEAAAELEKEGIDAEVLDPRTLRPLDTETILNSVRKTNRVVIVEEGWPYAGVGAQFVDLIQHKAFDYLDAPILRVTGADVPCTWAAFVTPLEDANERITRAWGQVAHLHGVLDSPALRDAHHAGAGIAAFEELLSACVELGVTIMVCEMGLKAENMSAEDLRADVPVKPGGVVTFLSDAGEDGRIVFV